MKLNEIDDLRRRRAGTRRQRQGRLVQGAVARRHRRGRGRTGRQAAQVCPHHRDSWSQAPTYSASLPLRISRLPWGTPRTAQLAAKEQNLRSTLERIGKFSPDWADELVQPIRHTKDDWGYRNKIELEPTVVNGRVRLGMHGVDPRKIVTVDSCPLFDKRFPKALKSVVGALNYLSGSHDLGLERVHSRIAPHQGTRGRTLDAHRLFSAPLCGLPRAGGRRSSHEHRARDEQGRKKARRVSKVEMLAGEGSWTENIAEGQMRLSAPSFFQVNTKGAEIF